MLIDHHAYDVGWWGRGWRLVFRCVDGQTHIVDQEFTTGGVVAQLDHDPFRSFAGSDEVKLALAAKIIEAHGGSAKFIDKKFVIELPLIDN